MTSSTPKQLFDDDMRPYWEPPMLDYRDFEEDGPLNMLLERQPGVDLKDWYYDESDAAIEEHLVAEYLSWVQSQGARSAAQLYLAQKAEQTDREGAFEERLHFFSGLEGELQREKREAEEKANEVHSKYEEKYGQDQQLSGEQRMAAGKWRKFAADVYRMWDRQFMSRMIEDLDDHMLQLSEQLRVLNGEDSVAMERIYHERRDSLNRVLNGLQQEWKQQLYGFNNDRSAYLRLEMEGVIQEVEALEKTFREHLEQLREAQIPSYPSGNSATAYTKDEEAQANAILDSLGANPVCATRHEYGDVERVTDAAVGWKANPSARIMDLIGRAAAAGVATKEGVITDESAVGNDNISISTTPHENDAEPDIPLTETIPDKSNELSDDTIKTAQDWGVNFCFT